ncbi:gamma-interferon-responsive lysosomal thiol protein [Impatiens glandulifera]|uniref:gamma-interferon-responsive lysosomal thiol protein n=1 Tax=Impatiens glandulifera TaxID=253017 RepID=UPI001FB18851|nr:gamma-interferon-responsive lysosomal thiol protein [Impatiens glandulifera]
MALFRALALSLIIIFFTISPIPVNSSRSEVSLSPHSETSDKVSVGLYYESLCPYSAEFIINNLSKLFDNGLISIVDLKLVPYGNAKITNNSTINCQHGPSECFLNTIEACAIDTWPDLNTHFPFINCVEKLVYDRKFPEWDSCFDVLGLDRNPVDECYSTGHGKELQLAYADETSALEPPHQYVPWVVVNGNPLFEDFENFMIYICEAYTGTYTPSACSSLAITEEKTRMKGGRTTSPVCEGSESNLSNMKSHVNYWVSRIAAVMWQ